MTNGTSPFREAVRPLAARRGILFEDFEQLLVKCCEDGKITPDESLKLALQLDFLCSIIANQRLKFWLTVALVVLALASTFALTFRIVSSTETSALREPANGEMPPSPDP